MHTVFESPAWIRPAGRLVVVVAGTVVVVVVAGIVVVVVVAGTVVVVVVAGIVVVVVVAGIVVVVVVAGIVVVVVVAGIVVVVVAGIVVVVGTRPLRVSRIVDLVERSVALSRGLLFEFDTLLDLIDKDGVPTAGRNCGPSDLIEIRAAAVLCPLAEINSAVAGDPVDP